MSDTVTASVKEARSRLLNHFSTYNGEKAGEGWSKLWDEGSFLPWDKGFPNPALIDLLNNRQDLIGNALKDVDGTATRKKALVPGCGRGVDIPLLASYGYDAVGLEVSQSAVDECEKWAREHETEYSAREKNIGQGSGTFVKGDFFKDDWLADVGMQGQTFDLIYDYTFFCAMNPAVRPQWAKRMTELLGPSPGANLICLEFPTSKPLSTGGPPFGSPSATYVECLSHPGRELVYDDNGIVKSNQLEPASPDGLERVAHWKPKDTHNVGKDADGNVRDFVAVWRHR